MILKLPSHNKGNSTKNKHGLVLRFTNTVKGLKASAMLFWVGYQ